MTCEALVVVPDASVLLKRVLRSDDEDDRDRAVALKSARQAATADTLLGAMLRKAERARHLRLLDDWQRANPEDD